jgi:osmotically-inducible protein OsmY
MPRDDWRDRDDYGQADYSDAYGYDPQRRAGYPNDDNLFDDRRFSEREREYARRMNSGDYPPDRPRQPRSWMDRAGAMFGGEAREVDDRRRLRRRGSSDRVLWAVIVERLDNERRLDLRDVDVFVEDGEVTLNGLVARKEDKRRIEDIADIDGVRHVQNNLRVREHGHWMFF